MGAKGDKPRKVTHTHKLLRSKRKVSKYVLFPFFQEEGDHAPAP